MSTRRPFIPATNLALFAGTAFNPTAGLITQTNPGTTLRQIQFALKLNF